MLLRRLQIFRKVPKQQRSSFTCEAILDAAQKLLLSENPDALHMATLARVAGVSAGSLYQYFPDRTSILGALLERIWERSVRDFRMGLKAVGGQSLSTWLDAVSALVAEIEHRDHSLRVIIHGILRREGVATPLTDVSEEWVSFFADALRPYFPENDEQRIHLGRSMVWAVDGMVDGVTGWPKLPASELHTSLRSAWNGIVAS